MCSQANLTIKDSLFYNNQGNEGGGLSLRGGCVATITRSAIFNNQSYGYGGGLQILNGAEVTINHSSIYGNESGAGNQGGGGRGAAIYLAGSSGGNSKPIVSIMSRLPATAMSTPPVRPAT